MIRYGLEFDYGDSDHIDRRVRRGVWANFGDLDGRKARRFSMWKGFEAVDRIGSRD